jgi:beta-xylosidase
VDRYGIETVEKWRCQCFNEPDISIFFLSELPRDAVEMRLLEYCKLYEAFERGVRRVSDRIRIGGPALAHRQPFLEGFLDHVKEKSLKLYFISLHSYGTSPEMLNDGSRPFCVGSLMEKYHGYFETIRTHGFGETPILIDEWGMASAGFYNREECPALMARESEVFSAYFVKLIHDLIHSDMSMELLAICLSGQHEMTEDFSGFRNFFTLNFIKKPIYNAHILASKLGDMLLQAEDREDLYVIPTKNEKGDYAVLLSYSSENFQEDLPTLSETVSFEEDIADRRVTVYCIDKSHTNPYRMWERAGKPQMTEALLKDLREEGAPRPLKVQKGSEPITLSLTPNATYLITVRN